jgi:hypothetical protein
MRLIDLDFMEGRPLMFLRLVYHDICISMQWRCTYLHTLNRLVAVCLDLNGKEERLLECELEIVGYGLFCLLWKHIRNQRKSKILF